MKTYKLLDGRRLWVRKRWVLNSTETNKIPVPHATIKGERVSINNLRPLLKEPDYRNLNHWITKMALNNRDL